jgi:hypothetical protein
VFTVKQANVEGINLGIVADFHGSSISKVKRVNRNENDFIILLFDHRCDLFDWIMYGRGRPPHLRWHSDGWRSLRFYLLMSPRWFLGIPGLALLLTGAIISVALFRGPISVGSVTFDYRTLMYSTSAIVLGYQSILLFIFAELMAIESGLHPATTKYRFLEQRRTLEWCIAAGIGLIVAGVVLGIIAARQWSLVAFGSLPA